MILYSDLIGLVITAYVWFQISTGHTMGKAARIRFFLSGLFITGVFLLDSAWNFIDTNPNLTAGEADPVLQVLCCLILICLFLAMVPVLFAGRKRKKPWLAIPPFAAIILIIILMLVNIRIPIFFYHENFQMAGTRYINLLYVMGLVVYIYSMVVVFLPRFDSDREDIVRWCFLFGMDFIGIVAGMQYDLLTLWICVAISYLFTYLTIREIHDKTDPITGLRNRIAFTIKMNGYRGKDNMTLAMFDLNNLKAYNDEFGHKRGDSYLRVVMDTMQERFKKYGRIYRIGGDEFCLITSHKSEELKTDIRDYLKATQTVGRDDEDGRFPLDIAYGIAEVIPGETPFQALERADARMYENKKATKAAKMECTGR